MYMYIIILMLYFYIAIVFSHERENDLFYILYLFENLDKFQSNVF